ncbi:MAG TPA: hypothetical protein VEU53_01430 [Stellaceae bacterium]|nr:hypothetical protein [Stellaceae bacterium]
MRRLTGGITVDIFSPIAASLPKHRCGKFLDAAERQPSDQIGGKPVNTVGKHAALTVMISVFSTRKPFHWVLYEYYLTAFTMYVVFFDKYRIFYREY